MKYEWTVLSFNLRTNTMEDGPNSFSFRFPFLCEVLNQRLPDLIGFQEITEDMRLQLTAALPDYYLVGGGRETDHLGESSCIAFRKDRFALDQLDTVWLSQSPHTAGSRMGADQSPCPRVLTCAVLTPLQKGASRFRFYNTHTDHLGAVSRLLASSQILQRIHDDSRAEMLPVLLTGDFNAEPDSPEMRLIAESEIIPLRDAAGSLGGTFHAFGEMNPPQKIDYIFCSPQVEVLSAELWNDRRDGLFLSDHDAVAVRNRL